MYAPTPAQRAIKQSAVAGTITAIATIAGGTYQYTLGHGLNVQALLLFLAPFVTGQALTLWHTLASNPQLQQAEADTVANLPAEIQELPGLIKLAHQKLDELFSVQHTHAAPVAQAPATPAPVAPTLPGPGPQFVSPVSMPAPQWSEVLRAASPTVSTPPQQ